MESKSSDFETYTSFDLEEADASFELAEADDESAQTLARLGALSGSYTKRSTDAPETTSPSMTYAQTPPPEKRGQSTDTLSAPSDTMSPQCGEEPAGQDTPEESDQLAEYTQEREQMRREVENVKLLIRQSEQELTRLNDKKAEAAAEVATIEGRLQHHSREEIRQAYLRSNEIEMRVFMLREEADKLKDKLKTLERYESFLSRAIETLATLPDPAQMSFDPQGNFLGVLTSGTLPPFLRDMAQRIATGDLPQRDTSAPPVGGMPPSLGKAASTRVVQAQEEVRAQVAQQLHTTVMQGLVNLALATEICEKLVRTDPEASFEELEHLKELINATLQQTTKTMMSLRPLSLEGQGLTATIQRFATNVTAEKGIPLSFSAPHAERKLAPDASVAVFRVAQEALENAVRHSQASEIRVTVAFVPNGLSVTVEDDGVGVNVEQAMTRAVQHQTTGIMGMLERAEMLGGWLRFESKPGNGATVELYAPL